MRVTCLNCARKHLAQASILMMEAEQGYPLHAWLAMGHMAEAADELVARYPEMANIIRENRKIYEHAVDEGEAPPSVPIVTLIADITKLADEEKTSSTSVESIDDEIRLLHEEDEREAAHQQALREADEQSGGHMLGEVPP